MGIDVMKTITPSIFLTLVLLVGLAPPAHANIEYPWCAQYGGGMGGGGTNCGFTTFEQCRLTLSGNGGFCVQNPFYPGSADRPAKGARKRHRN